ncbi:hypothetical protein ACCO45_006858 [Purpureocillium lilacinum]|uniref:Uncharacterized protein n=1 Tax=Purpureocillium lilacinum TaxID=33203 RepID=A0ACC4DQP3_PURLI
MSNATSYKQQKEDFVSNLSGGSVSEVNHVTAVAAVAVLLWSVLQSRQSFFKPYSPIGFVVDFGLNVGAFLLATTLYSSTPILLNILLVAPIALIYMLPLNTGARRKKPKVPPAAESRGGPKQLSPLPMKPFLTTYRGCMMVATCVAILAVDFRLFPRRFAKVETWGTSLMDMGVGSFVFASGVVAARPVLSERLSGRATPLHRRLLYSARHSVPLLVLGVIRLLSVKGLDYAEHVTEIVPSYAVLSLLVGGIYQALLESTDLKAYILTGPRTDLISMNREGIFSFLGYLAIFLAGQDLGMFIIPGTSTPGAMQARRVPPPSQPAIRAMGGCVQLCADTGVLLHRHGLLPAVYNAADTKTEKEAYETATSRVLRAFNRNGLAVFLLANLLTGLVNMTFRTLEATPIMTMAILLAYTATVTGVAVALDAYNISIKL